MTSPQQQLQSLTQQFTTVQQKLQEVVEVRQKLDSQLHENESVRTEFETLNAEDSIYKLIGPVLVKQDSLEAKQNVSRRIDLLKDETNRVEDEIKKLQGQTEVIKNDIIRLQQDSHAQEEATVQA